MQEQVAPQSPDITSKAHVGPGVGLAVASADSGVGDGVVSGVETGVVTSSHCRLVIPASRIMRGQSVCWTFLRYIGPRVARLPTHRRPEEKAPKTSARCTSLTGHRRTAQDDIAKGKTKPTTPLGVGSPSDHSRSHFGSQPRIFEIKGLQKHVGVRCELCNTNVPCHPCLCPMK